MKKYPVTFTQERRLIFEEYMWNSGAHFNPYHVSAYLAIDGPLNIAILEKALNSVIERHAGLRSAFMPVGDLSLEERELKIMSAMHDRSLDSGLYGQYIVDRAPLQINITLLESLDPEEQEMEIENILARSLEKPFDYARPPLMRAHLFQVSHDRYILALVLLHLICDLFSLQILKRELEVFYNSIQFNLAPSLPTIKRHFLEYAAQQQQLAKNNRYDVAVSYWRNQLIQFGPALMNCDGLPTIFRGFVNPTDIRGGIAKVTLEDSLQKSMEDFTRRKKISIFMLFISACMMVFQIIKKGNSTAIWSTLANRTDLNYVNAIGNFSNAHILGIVLSDHSTVDDVLREVRNCVLNAITNQDAPPPLILDRHPFLPHFGPKSVCCDMTEMPRNRQPENQTNQTIKIQNATFPEQLLGNWSNSLIIRFWYSQEGSMFTATFRKSLLGNDGIKRLLNEIISLIFWCVNNEDKRISEYVFCGQ